MNNTETLFANADKLAGQFATVTYAKEQKIRPAFREANTIIKRSTFGVRVGVEYANQAKVKEGHENGSVERIGLPASLEKITRSRYRNLKRNVDVLAIAPNSNSPRTTEWVLNGSVVPFEEVETLLYAQSKSSHSPAWMTLDFDNIEKLSGIIG